MSEQEGSEFSFARTANELGEFLRYMKWPFLIFGGLIALSLYYHDVRMCDLIGGCT